MSKTFKWNRLATDYPWPKSRPKYRDLQGWHSVDRQTALKAMLPAGLSGILVELGSWKGQSTEWFLKTYSGLRVVAIDHWKGSAEHHRMAVKKDLPKLYEIFVGNMWGYRERLIPMRETTSQGLRLVSKYGLQVEAIYVDAAHDYESVCNDIEDSIKLFPGSLLLGDDYPYHDVKSAVTDTAKKHNRLIRTKGRIWQLI